ncbi:ABD12-like protein [Mya arenaria]|uniref:ABD12-like protein n=1 Tax=Mya arenaria TaxID=6604 RepID=A0ABY7FF58_MYAAR|nr:ABD12-like protein [Mya arenaria]
MQLWHPGNPCTKREVQMSGVASCWIVPSAGRDELPCDSNGLQSVTAKLAKIICRNDEAPDGIFLESGFNNILDAATHHPMASPYKKMPWFHWLFLDTITENNIHFQSDQSIAEVSPPLLILHAEDDVIVPFHLGVKLYEAAVSTRPDMYGPAEFVPFNASLGYGHKLIFMAPELPDIIRKFMQLCQERKQKLLSESKLLFYL